MLCFPSMEIVCASADIWRLFTPCSYNALQTLHWAAWVQNHSAFTRSPLALVSALLGIQDPQSRFPILTRDKTRLIDAIHVIRKKSRESLKHKSKHIPSAARLSRGRQGKLLIGLWRRQSPLDVEGRNGKRIRKEHGFCWITKDKESDGRSRS